MQIGKDSPKWKAANAALEQAHAAVDQANAQLALIDTQISRLTVTAPGDGMVSEVAAQAGEVVAAGAQVMSLTRPDTLTITVYVSEEEVGSDQIRPGSHPDGGFLPGTVIYSPCHPDRG